MFDPTINVGSILTVLAMIAGIIVYITSGKSDMKVLSIQLLALDAQMEDFKLAIKKLTDITVEQARQDGRISNVETRMLMEGQRIDSMESTFREYLLVRKNVS